MTARLQGIVSDISYQNDDNGFAVVHLSAAPGQKSHICVGIMPTVVRGVAIAVEGEWESHRRYGPQFTVKSYEIVRPTTREGIAQMLGSGLIPHIGPSRANTIIEMFGVDTLRILDEEPQQLLNVPGIGKKTHGKIVEAWNRQRHIRELVLFLQDYGVTINLAAKIYKQYGSESRRKISENPYILIEDIWGVGFTKADHIATKMGFQHDSYKRIRAGLVHIMQEACGEGHSFLPYEEIVARGELLLQVSREHVTFSLDHALETRMLFRDQESVYLPSIYHAERSVAEALARKVTCSQKEDPAAVDNWLVEYQRRTGFSGDSRQLEAIRQAIRSSVFLLTGGPGTGKTTILQVIVAYMRERNRVVVLAAPTGRAAQRMGSISGLSARTLHRLLEFRPAAGSYSFARGLENPIDADMIIVDEMSMVDILLMRSFMEAVKDGTQVVFVGDHNQLPSVGAGSVLSDMIACGVIPHVHLTTIFRQAASSRIVTAAHEIIVGSVPRFANVRGDNCFMICEEDPERTMATIVDLVSRRLPSKYGFDPIGSIQVLSPMHKGVLGTQNLNAVLQSALNPNSRQLNRGQISYRCGDKVMQIRNNYDLEVFNGDIGVVSDVTEDSGLVVTYDGNSVKYESKDIDDLVPAYCISIHKSQGCEFRAVVMPLSTQHFIMLQRNLLYTALTRARELCVMVGSLKALSIAVKSNQALNRYSALDKKLVSVKVEG